MKVGMTVPKNVLAHKLITYAVNHATEEEMPQVVTAVKRLPIIDRKYNGTCGTVIDERV